MARARGAVAYLPVENSRPEIDENLIRSELTPSQRADHTARRKAIYETLYPAAKHGATLKKGDKLPSGQIDHSGTTSFAESTAQATGRSRESVNRDARRGSRIDPAVMADPGTKADTGVFLDYLYR